ncbi:cytochrome c [uncultured Boseongicola sp.]|jgi:mono/diheme cytochrome c family protein|uniref:c-type cytochrome n=1 Tax=uncultured Boseongicola sp. TaxID=1648499 RepID=UPI002631CD3B|nr:cytochrome c [uncultured Boseongicola sp.]
MKTLTLLAIFLASTASAQDVAQGRDVFQNHCATCHGTGARGDGPMADVLSVVPTDLTALAASNGGEFPTARVVRRVDGQREVLAHGGPMPLWGMILDGPAAVIVAPDGAEIVAPEAIVDVAAWLATVQR